MVFTFEEAEYRFFFFMKALSYCIIEIIVECNKVIRKALP
ncbi:hypothetical protein HMPREF3202_00299 [Prevotella bivia]|uniref:Uncharacterized protein n=1 Tax=Prevotella bivia TaxID=28125 RepID=A0A137T0G1_9BACT|nr:hypothetical protein HMPREF3202_00299 [Prevotella bivia]